ncbi:hypothetical protein Q3G72_010406 [Acer saccharum]|nr:hypothetical protein Q3G72_010406 [Acer saccharum]
MNNQMKIIGHRLPLRYPRRANIIENNSRLFSIMFPSNVPSGPMMSQSTIPLGPVMFPSTVPSRPVMSPYMVPSAPPSAVSLAPTTFQIWNRSNSLNFGGNSSTDQAMASSSSNSSSSINNSNTLPQPILFSSNNDIGKGKGLMMDPSPVSDKNSIPVADAPSSGHDNTTSETNAQTGFQFNACRADPNMDEKKHRRTMSNRQSAERIRKKRAQYVSELERKLKNLEVRVAVQRHQISQDKEHVLQMEHLKRLNQILTDKKNGLMRINASIAQNKEAVKIWRQQELIQQQKMMQMQQRHRQKKMQMQQKQHQHQQKIMQMQQQQLQQQQQQQQRMPVWEAGLEGRIMNPNPSSNQSGWLDQQQMGYPNSIQGIYGVNPEEMNRLNQHVMNQPAANRFNQHVTMNQPAANRLNQIVLNQPAANRLNEHVTVNQPAAAVNQLINNMFNNKHIIINQPAGVLPEYSGARPVTNDHQYGSARALQNTHQMLINNNRLNQPAAVEHGSARIETNDGHELLMNSNILNQQIPMNHQVLVNQSAAAVECAQKETNGGHELLVNSNWLNQQQVPMNQPAAMVYSVAPANGGHEQLILNSNRLNQQVLMNQSAAAEYGGSTNDHQLLMNYQPQPGQMMVSTDWDQLGMDLQMPNQLPGQMMAPPDNWDQLGMVQMPNPNSNMTINPNYRLDELEQFKNLNLNPPNLPN